MIFKFVGHLPIIVGTFKLKAPQKLTVPDSCTWLFCLTLTPWPLLLQLLKQARVEQLIESRYCSSERMIGFMVTFHAMARKVADFWPLRFDINRSQSGLRIATTAAPVAAPDRVILQRHLKAAQSHASAAAENGESCTTTGLLLTLLMS
jgi:hypothetical protein